MTIELRATKPARENGVRCVEAGSPVERVDELDMVQPRKVRLTEANWDLFRLFFAVARTGSVNRAARELAMSSNRLSAGG